MRMEIHEFPNGGTMTDLIKQLVKYRAVRINFNYNPSRHGVETLAKRAQIDIKNKLKHPVREVKFFQHNKPEREFDSWVFTLSVPSNNMEAKHFLSESFM
jgi:hypothetical protein